MSYDQAQRRLKLSVKGTMELNKSIERKAEAGFSGAHGWAAIELAPKDGTRLLLWCGDEVEVGYWSTSSWVQNVKPDGTLTDGAWIIYENRSDTIELAPTHWQPLPLPPNAEVSDGSEPPQTLNSKPA